MQKGEEKPPHAGKNAHSRNSDILSRSYGVVLPSSDANLCRRVSFKPLRSVFRLTNLCGAFVVGNNGATPLFPLVLQRLLRSLSASNWISR